MDNPMAFRETRPSQQLEEEMEEDFAALVEDKVFILDTIRAAIKTARGNDLITLLALMNEISNEKAVILGVLPALPSGGYCDCD